MEENSPFPPPVQPATPQPPAPNPTTTPFFDRCPTDVLLHLFTYLSIPERVRLRALSHTLRSDVDELSLQDADDFARFVAHLQHVPDSLLRRVAGVEYAERNRFSWVIVSGRRWREAAGGRFQLLGPSELMELRDEAFSHTMENFLGAQKFLLGAGPEEGRDASGVSRSGPTAPDKKNMQRLWRQRAVQRAEATGRQEKAARGGVPAVGDGGPSLLVSKFLSRGRQAWLDVRNVSRVGGAESYKTEMNDLQLDNDDDLQLDKRGVMHFDAVFSRGESRIRIHNEYWEKFEDYCAFTGAYRSGPIRPWLDKRGPRAQDFASFGLGTRAQSLYFLLDRGRRAPYLLFGPEPIELGWRDWKFEKGEGLRESQARLSLRLRAPKPSELGPIPEDDRNPMSDDEKEAKAEENLSDDEEEAEAEENLSDDEEEAEAEENLSDDEEEADGAVLYPRHLRVAAVCGVDESTFAILVGEAVVGTYGGLFCDEVKECSLSSSRIIINPAFIFYAARPHDEFCT